MTINLSDAACDYVASKGTDTTYGARPLRRAIQRLLEDPIAEQVLEGRWTSGSVIDVDFKDGELTFTKGSGSIPKPRKRDTIAREADLLMQGYDLNDTSHSLNAGPSSADMQSGGAAD
jgi:ATP-dependent Clp protease ATP-binding subunit ClpC